MLLHSHTEGILCALGRAGARGFETMWEDSKGSVSACGVSQVLGGVLEGRPCLRVMAIASCGGHWVQLRKLARAFEGHDVSYVTVSGDYRAEVGGARFYSVIDANLSDKLKLVWLALQMVFVVLRERPDVVVSTGAAPGFFGLAWGKLLLGSRTIWVDSIANSERLSASGRHAGRFADLWLTQWKHLRSNTGPRYEGAIL